MIGRIAGKNMRTGIQGERGNVRIVKPNESFVFAGHEPDYLPPFKQSPEELRAYNIQQKRMYAPQMLTVDDLVDIMPTGSPSYAEPINLRASDLDDYINMMPTRPGYIIGNGYYGPGT